MKDITRIGPKKGSTFRRHYLAEWLERRDMEPMDLWRSLNESGDESFIDKKQVYRWLEGALPHKPTQIRIAAALKLLDPETDEPDPEKLTRHPDHDWFAQKTRGRPKDEVERMKAILDNAFPDRDGANG